MPEIVVNTNIKREFLKNFIPQDFPDTPFFLKIKEEAERALNDLEFPASNNEHWKYTRIAKILRNKYTQSPAKDLPDVLKFWKPGNTHLFVFINGFFSAELSATGGEKGAVILPLSKARRTNPGLFEKHFGSMANHREEIFAALNTIYHTNGVFVFTEDNVKLKKPVHIVNITASDRAAYNPRNLIVLGKNSRADIIFSFETLPVASSCSFINSVTEMVAGNDSLLSLYLLQNDREGSQVNTINVKQNAGSNTDFFTLSTGGKPVRNNLNISIEGEHCVSNLHGLYIINNEQHIDNHTQVDHKSPGSLSNELYKGIMNGKSTGVFNGKVHVYKDAQKTNAYQSNQNILLSDEASVNSKPELEIYANDVKCSHGSATGQLDEEAIFYMRSRGIGAEQARKLLIHAFAGEVIDKIGLSEVKEEAIKLVHNSL